MNSKEEIQKQRAYMAARSRCECVIQKHPNDWEAVKEELIERKDELVFRIENHFDKVFISVAQIHAREELKEIELLLNKGV